MKYKHFRYLVRITQNQPGKTFRKERTVITNRVDINQVLMQMRALKAESRDMDVKDIAPGHGINPAQ